MSASTAEDVARIAATGDPVAALHRQITGTAARLHIHLKDPIQVRDAAKALRVLASTLEMESHSKDETWRVLFRMRAAIEITNRLIGGSRHRRKP